MKGNTSEILQNKYSIDNNKKCIEDNQKAIDELKRGYVPLCIVEDTAKRYGKIIHGLITIICLMLVSLFICNAIWLYAWKQMDFGNTTITQEGETNKVGGE